MAALHLGSEGESTDGVNGKVGIGTATPGEVLEVTGNIKTTNSSYMIGHLLMGPYHIWVDNVGRLRIKNGPPMSALDGTIVGSQG
jgi:hypothetical protein